MAAVAVAVAAVAVGPILVLSARPADALAAGSTSQSISFTSTAPTDATVGGPTYTATATATSGLAVVLTIDASSASVCSIDGAGVVSFTAVGTCVIDANQAGDTNYAPAPQQQQSFSVAQGSQSITFTSTPSNPTVGATYTPTATGGGSGNPVVFSIDTASTPGACTISSGTVSFTGAGTCILDANQAGDTNYTAAPQEQLPITVAQASQSITFTSTPSNPTVGATYTPTATGGGSGNPVVFSIDPSSSNVCSIDGAGVVSFTAVGTCVIDANQAGDSNYTAAPQQQLIFSVGQGSQTINWTSTTPAETTVGAADYTPTATGGDSTQPVVFSIDAGSTTGACTLTSGTVSFTGAGICIIDANQAGDTNYTAAPQEQQTITVDLNPQTISFTSTAPTNVTVGSADYVVTATGGASGNPVLFTIDAASTAGACTISSATVSFTGAGTCVIDANQAGDGVTYAPAMQKQQTITVGQASQSINFTSTAPTSVTVNGPGYTPTATGGGSTQPVVFTIDPSSTPGACTLNSGVVSFTGAGTCVIDANQAGDTNYTAAPQEQQTIVVSQNPQMIVFTSSATDVSVGASYMPTATGGGSAQPVVFTIDPSSTPGACTISGGTVSFTGAGTCVIDADQAGTAAYGAAQRIQQSVTVHSLPSSTTISVGTSGVTATVTGGGPAATGSVTFSVNGTVVGTAQLSGGVAKLSHSFSPGQTYTVQAQYAGSGAYSVSSATATYTAPRNPPRRPPLKITVKLTSSHPERNGWWTAPVTVTFTCTRGGKRVAKCRPPVRLTRSGAGQLVAGHRINIDRGRPALHIGGLNAGAIYLVSTPMPRCLAKDGISGIRSCTIHERAITQGAGAQALTFTARAVSGAGTVTVRSVTVTKQRAGPIGPVSSVAGIYVFQTARGYTLQVASRIKPLYVDGAVAPQVPSGAHNWFALSGHHQGIPLWELSISLPAGLPASAYWNVGVRIGSSIRIIAIRD